MSVVAMRGFDGAWLKAPIEGGGSMGCLVEGAVAAEGLSWGLVRVGLATWVRGGVDGERSSGGLFMIEDEGWMSWLVLNRGFSSDGS
ncbi:hypothetical protein V6N11_078742 [Hibiscus sabdariffa]|uniref:Uncharacterized protein n=1 Tax=Hibiscus sabdariffa TaxID=183260 RepID=A0ABR1ZCX2_9ROSI